MLYLTLDYIKNDDDGDAILFNDDINTTVPSLSRMINNKLGL